MTFGMWVQCREVAHAVAMDKHFEGTTFTLSSGGSPLITTCHVARPTLGCEACCWIVPTNLGRSAIATESEAQQVSELGALLYGRLTSSPSFWVALVGIDVDDVRTDRDVADVLKDDGASHEGLIVALKIWREAGEPAGFERFRPGYMWRPYRGERVNI